MLFLYPIKNRVLIRAVVTCLYSQHLGGRGSWISGFKASLVYKMSSKTAKDTQKNLGCPGTHSVDQAGLELRNPTASASQVLGLKACTTTPGS